MTIPDVLKVAGVACLATGGVLAMASIRYFVTQDIKGVYDDLAGRLRQRGIDEAMHERSKSEEHPPKKGDGPVPGNEEPKTRLVTSSAPNNEQTVVVSRDDSLPHRPRIATKGGE
jgi:hypothetical protein